MGSLKEWVAGRLPVRRSVVEEMRRVDREQIEHRLQKQITALESLIGLSDSQIDPNPETSLYREITAAHADARSARDFSTEQADKIRKLANTVYALRGDGQHVIDLHLDFVVGDDFKPVAKKEHNTELQKELDEIWTTKENRLDRRHERMTLSLFLEGELFIPADLNTDGTLGLGFMPPENVVAVVQDYRGRDAFVQTKNDRADETEPKEWFVLDSMTDDIEIEPIDGATRASKHRYTIIESVGTGSTVEVKRKDVYGLMFAWFLNRPEGATRGRSELASIIDYIDVYDELLWSTVQREKLIRFFLLHITAEDIRTPQDATNKLRELGLLKAPTGPRVIATNEKVTSKIDNPTQNAEPSNMLLGQIATSIYGAKGFPETWRGSSGKANLASARAMDVVPMRRLRRKQRQIVGFWKRLIEVSLVLKDVNVEDTEFTIAAFEVGGKDKQRGALILKEVTTALAQALSGEYIEPEAANEILLQAAQEAGFSISIENRGVPEGASKDYAQELERLAMQFGGGNSRQDGEGNQDEEDRDRGEERVA